MRLRPGLNFNFTVLELDAMLRELFTYDPDHPEWFRLPQGIVPLCNNSSLNRIIAMMPLFDSHGLNPTWEVPEEIRVREFFDSLEERPVDKEEQKGLTRATTDAEMARIATRLEEAKAAAEAGEFGFTVEEADTAQAASSAGENEPAEEGELAGQEDAGPSEPVEETGTSSSSSSSSEEDPPRAESPAPPRRRLRKLGDVAERQGDQQSPRRATRSTTARTGAAGASHTAAATGAGSSQTTAAAPAKRQRDPTPPPPRTRKQADFDFSALSSDEEEEEE